MKHIVLLLMSAIAICFVLCSGCHRNGGNASLRPAAPGEFVFGMLLIGPYNDHGWSQAHYEAGKYVEKKIGKTRMLYVDKVNPTDRPGTTPSQLAEDLLSKGAKLIIFNSDDMKDGALEFAKRHPEIPVIHASGDNAWKGGRDYKALPNLANVMGRMEYGQMIAGCAAALSTATGKIGYLGPLINDETRRLAASAFLGAKHCWTDILGKPEKDLSFKVTWIGFWFNLPGVTSDPTQVANNFFTGGYDVVISGIDTTEALIEAKKISASGKRVLAIPYDYKGACSEAKDVCLGVPYYNWGPAYVRHITAIKDGTWKPSFEWEAPFWENINDENKSPVGFEYGKALDPDVKNKLEGFVKSLGGDLNLWSGPIRLQSGSIYVGAGSKATDSKIWYLPHLLSGMEGQSVSK